jgi:hypothetical protein
MVGECVNHHVKADRVFQQGGNVAELDALLRVVRDGAD